jgi:hypothetical protein
MRDVIVLLPGISGSRLKRGDTEIWGSAPSAVGRILGTLGASAARDLALISDPPDRDDLGDGVVADALIPDLHLLPGFWKIDGYTKVAETIRAVFDVEDGRNFFEFPYDWRRDNRVAARRLQSLTKGWLDDWRARSGNADAKLILVAHSMGGLVARYFLECLGGWEASRGLITFATPFRGSLNAVDTLSNGMKMGPRGLIDMTAAARTFTSIYQLLPIYRCYRRGGGLMQLVEAVTGKPVDPRQPRKSLDELGEAKARGGFFADVLPNIDPVKMIDAAMFHYEILAAEAVNEASQDYLASRYRIRPIIGVEQSTSQSFAREAAGLAVSASYPDPQHPEFDQGGDGTVPVISADPSRGEAGRNAAYAATKHGSVQNADTALVNLRHIINNLYANLGVLMGEGEGGVRLALEVSDLLLEGESATVRATPRTDGEIGLEIAVYGDDDTTPVDAKNFERVGPEGAEAEFPKLKPGAYRVRVSGAGVETAEDSFAVVATDSGSVVATA